MNECLGKQLGRGVKRCSAPLTLPPVGSLAQSLSRPLRLPALVQLAVSSRGVMKLQPGRRAAVYRIV